MKIIVALLMMSLTGQVKAEDMSLHFAVSDREVRSLTAEQMEKQIQPQQAIASHLIIQRQEIFVLGCVDTAEAF